MDPLPRVDAIPLFDDVQDELINLLKSLSDEEWKANTWSRKWNVKDVAAHLLDGDLRRLSLHRDAHTLPDPESPISDYHSLVNFLNALNEQWVTASQRLSPRLIIELTEFLKPKVVEHLRQLDPEDNALFAVDWAGEEESQNWFDIAREYTEKWHHQQQIQEAVGRPLLTERKWLQPLMETLIRAVPPVYNQHASEAPENTIRINVGGVVDDSWLLTNSSGQWELFKSDGDKSDITITMNQTTAWQIFTKHISERKAIEKLDITGNQQLGTLLVKTVSFMK